MFYDDDYRLVRNDVGWRSNTTDNEAWTASIHVCCRPLLARLNATYGCHQVDHESKISCVGSHVDASWVDELVAGSADDHEEL